MSFETIESCVVPNGDTWSLKRNTESGHVLVVHEPASGGDVTSYEVPVFRSMFRDSDQEKCLDRQVALRAIAENPMTATTCPITGQPAEKLPPRGDRDEYRSPFMRGRYAVSGTARAILESRKLDERERVLLIEWVCRERLLKDEECPCITSYVLDEVIDK